MDKQQGLCLTTAHLDCPLFEAAAGLTAEPHLGEAVRAAAELDPRAVPAALGETRGTGDEAAAAPPSFAQPRRPMPRTTPVILDRARPALDVHVPRVQIPSFALRRPNAGGRREPTGEAPRTRIEELRAERLRVREASAAVAVATDISVERGLAQSGTPAPTADRAGVAPRPHAVAERPPTGSSSTGSGGGARGTGPGGPAGGRGSGGGDGGGRFGGRFGSGGGGLGGRFGGRFGSAGRPRDDGGDASRTPDGGRSGSDRDLDRSGLAADRPVPKAGPRRFSPPGGFGTLGRVGSARGGLDGVRAAMAGREIQAALAGLLGLALVLVLVVRFSGGSSAGVAGASSSPRPATAASTGPSGSAQPRSPAASPSTALQPSPKPAVTPKPSLNPTQTPAARTYIVKPGDTLSAIAAQFGTSAATLMRLNNIKDARSLRIGQVLKLP